MLATLLGYDYSVYRPERPEAEPAYRVRFVPGSRQAAVPHDFRDAAQRPVQAEWVYDIECAGLHNFVCGVGNIVCHNTNEPEYRRLQNNEFMEALRDRTVKIDVPYVTRLKDEIKIYEKDFNRRAREGQAHRAAHHRDRGHVGSADAAGAAQARQPDPPPEAQALQRQDAAGLHRRQRHRAEARGGQRGHAGHQPRYIQDKISNAIVAHPDKRLRQPVHGAHELDRDSATTR